MTVRRSVPYLLVVFAALAGLGALPARPAAAAPPDTVDYVILAGAAGLRWDDLDPQRTPTLWRAAAGGSIGWLSVRSASRITCPADGWSTLGAGNYAAWGGDGPAPGGQCPAAAPELEQPDDIGAYLPLQRTVVRNNRDVQPYGAVPGALAESVRCTVAVGTGAAIAAARPFGRVDRYEPRLPVDARPLLSSCVLSIVDLGAVAGQGDARRAAAGRVDALLARVLAARPARSLVFVAGIADTEAPSRLHVAIADGPGWQGGWLTSAGTRRQGFLQLVDLAPTALAALGRPAPQRLFVGKPADVAPGRPSSLTEAISGARDADRRAVAQRRVSPAFFGALAAVQLILFVLVIPLLVRARRHAGPTGPAAPPRALLATVEVALVAAALAVAAAVLTDLTPWWRASWPGALFALICLAITAAATVAVRAVRRYPTTLWPMGAVAAVVMAVVGGDVLTGSRLQLNGVAGYSALQGARYAGVGSVGLGLLVAGTLLAAGCLAQAVRRPWRPVVVGLVGAAAVIVVGSPYLGADPVGAVAVTAGVCVAAALSSGGWLTLPRLAWATLAGLAVTTGFAVLDLRRPAGDQGSLGRFLTALGDGTAAPAVRRTTAANAWALTDNPLTVLALIGAAMLAFTLLSPWGGLKRLFGLHPAVRAALVGTAVATLLAGPLSGTALYPAGAAAAVAVPLAVLTALRVLDHAADRTRMPDDRPPGDAGPPAITDGAPAVADGDPPSLGVPAGNPGDRPARAESTGS